MFNFNAISQLFKKELAVKIFFYNLFSFNICESRKTYKVKILLNICQKIGQTLDGKIVFQYFVLYLKHEFP